MSTSVVLPALGESVTEGTVTRWLKKVGDTVEADEGLLEISTDKVDTEIPSPVGGVIEEIFVQEDETVEVGAILAKIGDGSGAGAAPEQSDAAPAQETPEQPEAEQSAPAPEQPEAEQSAPAPEEPAAEQPAAAGTGRACVVRRWQGCRAARTRRERHRGNRHALAEEGRRHRRGR